MHFLRSSGDTFTIDFSIEMDPDRSLIGVQVVSSFARHAGDTPLLVKKNTAAGGTDDQIIVVVNGTTLSGAVLLLPADLRDLIGELEWDIVAKLADGAEVTLARGTLTLKPRVSRTVP